MRTTEDGVVIGYAVNTRSYTRARKDAQEFRETEFKKTRIEIQGNMLADILPYGPQRFDPVYAAVLVFEILIRHGYDVTIEEIAGLGLSSWPNKRGHAKRVKSNV